LGLAKRAVLGGAARRRMKERVLGELVELGSGAVGPTAQVLDAVFAVVDGDAIEPGAEARVAAEAVDRLEDGDEDFLRHVLGLRRAAEHAEGQAVDLVLKAAHALDERLLIALLQPPDQVFFALGVHGLSRAKAGDLDAATGHCLRTRTPSRATVSVPPLTC